MADRPLSDTSAEARAVMDAIYRKMTPAQKLLRVRDLTLMANQLALEGLRKRYPGDTESQLLLRLARIRLGDALVEKAYPMASVSRGAR